MNVRALAKHRQSSRLRHAASSRLAALSRETRVPVDVLRTFAGISDPRNAHQFTVAAFHRRGERAWQQYLRDGVARPIDEVFDELDARVAAAVYARTSGRREIDWSVGALLAQGATSVTFPPAPPAEDWDWEPPSIELPLKPDDLDD
jgi:hypothetical protein